MRRFQAALCIIGFAAAFGAGASLSDARAAEATAGPALAPAEFKPLPVDTLITYADFGFGGLNERTVMVTKSDGFLTVTKVWGEANAAAINTYGLFGEFATNIYVSVDGGEPVYYDIENEERKKLGGFWPLKVGKETSFKLNESATDNTPGQTWAITLKVLNTEVLNLNGYNYPTYMVEEQAQSSEGMSFVGRKWYQPDAGLIIKSTRTWTGSDQFCENRCKGSYMSKGEKDTFSLIEVLFPMGTTTHILPEAEASGSPDEALIAEVRRLKRKAEDTRKAEEGQKAEVERAKRQAETKYKAEIAALKKEAEAKGMSEARATEKAEQYKAEIERQRREAEDRQKAELARRQQAAVSAARTAPAKPSESALWATARNSRSMVDVRSYLDHYPQGRYADDARARLSVLKKFADMAGVDFGAYHALVIGNQDYQHLPDLQTPVKDAQAVARVLAKDYGFTVKTLINATRDDINDALDGYRNTLRDSDNLLIYYAGHGWLDEDTERGYWLPVDAKRNLRSRWLSNATITDTLKGLLAKHAMVVADSCYSGALLRGGAISVSAAKYWKKMVHKRARVVLTSGGLEPVADRGGGGHSPFAKAFLDALADNEAVMDGTTLFGKMRRPVMVNANQTPEYSDVRNAGHDGGDFLFVKKF